MTEDFLHHLWKFRLFDQSGLMTTRSEPVEIIRAGDHNTDAGPDFFNARLRIGKTLWAGNVEIHIHASDWRKHGHDSDPAYDNIILHVVYHADEELKRASGELIPTVEIKSRIPLRHYQRYLDFRSSAGWIPCQKQFSSLPLIVLQGTLDKLLIERLSKKADQVNHLLKRNNNDWEESFYQALARNFGFHTNAAPFELLARSLPSALIARHRNSLLQIEAMLFGQAGMLEDHFSDHYLRSLQNEYAFLKRKFSLCPMNPHLWKYLRLRPSNFPTLRIAQFASLLFNSGGLFAAMLEKKNAKEFQSLLQWQVSEYWTTHYSFEKKSPWRSNAQGEEARHNILINTVVPFLFVYGKMRQEQEYADRALKLLEELPGEANAVIRKWKELGAPVQNAGQTQALLQLRNEYCQHKKCLSCNVGNYLLKNS